jgi:hypothetical protein
MAYMENVKRMNVYAQDVARSVKKKMVFAGLPEYAGGLVNMYSARLRKTRPEVLPALRTMTPVGHLPGAIFGGMLKAILSGVTPGCLICGEAAYAGKTCSAECRLVNLAASVSAAQNAILEDLTPEQHRKRYPGTNAQTVDQSSSVMSFGAGTTWRSASQT